MNKVVIPIEGDFLSEAFNDCTSYHIYEIDTNDQIRGIIEIPSQKKSSDFSMLAKQYEITDLIVHSIDRVSLNFFTETKVNLFIGVELNTPDRLIEEYLKGSLKSNTHSFSKIDH